MATPVSGADRWLTINGRPLSFRENDENSALSVREYSDNYIEMTHHAPRYLTISVDGEPLSTSHYGIWLWKAKDYAGLYQLTAEAPGVSPQRTWIRVFSHKFTQPIYEKMKDELSEIAADLLFCLISPASEKTTYSKRSQEISSLQEYKQVRIIIEEMRDVMSHIRRDPHYTLQEQHTTQSWQEVRYFGENAHPLPGDHIQLPAQLGRRPYHIPNNWLVKNAHPTYDTYENRLLKHFLERQLVAKLSILGGHAASERKKHADLYTRYRNEENRQAVNKLTYVMKECQQMQQRCLHWSSEPFLKTVQSPGVTGKASQVLLKHPSYNRFYRLYLRFLQERLSVTLNTEQYVTDLAMRKVSELYEMWSIFTLTRIAIDSLLEQGYRMVSNTTFYELDKDYFQFEVRKNFSSIILDKGDLSIEIKYEPIYPNHVNVTSRSALVAAIGGGYPLTPDLAFEVYRSGEPQDVLIFDAKYRRQREPDGFYYPKEEDIEKMHSYRNRIQYKRYQPGRSRPVFDDIVTSAYILYPGNRIYTEARNRIGGLPLRPNISARHLGDVKEQLKDIFTYASLI